MGDPTPAQDPHAERPRPFEPAVFGIALAAFVLWTVGVMTGWADDTVDTWLPEPSLEPRSYLGQVAEAFCLVTNPYFILVVIVALAVRSYRRRQRQLAIALAIGALGIPVWQVLRWIIDRPRPESAFEDSLSAVGPSYTSGHLVAVTILLWVLVTVANAQRLSTSARMRGRVLGGLLIVVTFVDQWAMSIARLSDMVGGWIFGVLVAAGALWVGGLGATRAPWRERKDPQPEGRQAAVIYNPTKVLELDPFRRRVTYAMTEAGWAPPLWFETREDDPGNQMARDALAKGVDRVLVAGGDGTARAVCEELAGSGVPVALIPAGTGNLLGRNLGIPLDEDQAIEIAIHGTPAPVDAVCWRAAGGDEVVTVMAGVGLDAQIMRDTDPRLKKVVKGGAYVVAGIRQVGAEPFRATVTVDGRAVHDGNALMVLVGNVGKLQGGVTLLPDASPADGRLHVLVARGGGIRGYVGLLGGMLGGITGKGSTAAMRRVKGRSVEVRLDREVPYQLDGDTAGSTDSFSAEIMHEALLVMRAPDSDDD